MTTNETDNLGKFRVLMVDDNRELMETFKDILEFSGFKITAAYDGFEAVEMARQTAFDLVLLDLIMPGLTGVETMRQIRAIRPDTRFILITAYSGTEQANLARQEGAEMVFSKPLIVKDVVRALKALLTGSAGDEPTKTDSQSAPK